MLVENQLVKTTWSTSNYDWYISKGYQFTKYRGSLYVFAEDLMANSSVLVDVQCDYCGDIYKTQYCNYVRSIKNVQKSSCSNPLCRGQKIHDSKINKYKYDQYNSFVNLCKERGYNPISTIDDYNGAFSKLEYECPIHGIQETTVDNLRRHGCKQCGYTIISSKIKYSPNEVIDIVKQKGTSILLNLDEYVNCNERNLRFKCGDCGNLFTTSLLIFRAGTGKCLECAKEEMVKDKRTDTNIIKEMIESKNDNIWLNQNEYKTASKNNLLIRCGTCGNIFKMSYANYRKDWFSGKCRRCSEKSTGEKQIAQVLDRYKINYTRQEHFDGKLRDVKPIPLDFYLPDYNMAVEFDGILHYEPMYGEEKFKKTLLHDDMKNWYCKWNNIDLLRIPYWEGSHIEEILIEKFNIIPLVSIETKHHTIKYIPTKYRK